MARSDMRGRNWRKCERENAVNTLRIHRIFSLSYHSLILFTVALYYLIILLAHPCWFLQKKALVDLVAVVRCYDVLPSVPEQQLKLLVYKPFD